MRIQLCLFSLFLSVALLGGCQDEPAGDRLEPAAPTAAAEPDTLPPVPPDLLRDRGPAPEIVNETWINTPEPVTLASLRGKVVLIEFWTFGCINCKRVLPYIQQWQTRYGGEDFAVVTVHYPEFSYERDVDNVRAAVEELGITFPVAIDNDRVTWAAYEQRYWPTIFLVDRRGRLRYKKIGEGEYDLTEAAIVALIDESR